MHHQPQYHPHPAATASAKPRHLYPQHPQQQQQQRYVAHPQAQYPAGPRYYHPQQQQRAQIQQQQPRPQIQQQQPRPQPQQPRPQQIPASHEDVLARAQAIARAQAQIQAQMQSYATQPQPQKQQQQRSNPIFYGQAFANASGAQQRGPAAVLSTSRTASNSSSSSVASTASSASSHGRHAQPQPQQTLHQLHQRSTGSNPTATSKPTASAQPATAPKDSSSRVEWRVAVDPKSKRPYYYHPITRETTWKKPQELVEKEQREKKHFFLAMENNIRTKLRSGTWLKDGGDNNSEDANQQAYRHSDIGVPSSSFGSHSSRSADRVRSSLSSMESSNSSGGRKQKPRALGLQGSRSAPNTPEFAALSLKPSDASLRNSNNQDSTDDDDDELDDEDELTAAASKPPLLFRTLSSYETPVVMEKKQGGGMTGGIVGSRLVTIPSPIQERVRLATGSLQPRASDLESYTQSTGRPDPIASAAARQPLRRRSNSTSTIYVRMGTMNAPDQDCTIKCVATVLRAHMVEAVDAPIVIDAKFDVFVNRKDRESDDAATSSSSAAAIPSLQEIAAFIKHVFARAQMESECIIMSLVYVERLLKATSGSLQLRAANWRSLLFCSMVMASKVWDDLSMCNADFSKIWPELSLKDINELELAYLSAVEYNVRVSAVSYAKYYFHLRSMCATMGMLAAFDESAPLNLDGARKMQVLSEEYQERSKLLPAPRRRSVTITATTVESRAAAGSSSQHTSNSKASPAASLEQLVHMQVRGAGGSALSSMHRLSTKN